MKRILTSLTVLAALSIAALAGAQSDHHVRANLVPIEGSGVSGFVQITQLPHGGSNLHVVATGLHPGTVYASFYYESADCSAAHDLLATFTAGPSGTGEVSGKIDDDVDEVGSVSVRIGPDYGTLLACATIH